LHAGNQVRAGTQSHRLRRRKELSGEDRPQVQFQNKKYGVW
jgi:hypothetical protein